VRVCAYVCAHAQNASQRARQGVRVRVRAERRAARDGDLHQGITVHMHSIIGARARMYTGMRALAECFPACVRGRGRGRAHGGSARAAGARAFTNCVSLRTFYIDVYLYMNVGTYGCIMACLCMFVCV
jgi:hypothetical protein